MQKIRVGVLRGGSSNGYEISLKTGGDVLSGLRSFLPEKYRLRDILITKDNQWHLDGLPASYEKIFNNIDVAFNCLHEDPSAGGGENDSVHHVFEAFQVPHTGSGLLASSVSMNKVLSRGYFEKAGIKIPRAIIVEKDEDPKTASQKIFQQISPSWVVKPASAGYVKPASAGYSADLFVVESFAQLAPAIESAQGGGGAVLVEEHINGKRAICGVLENFREQNYYSLLVHQAVRGLPTAHFNKEIKNEIEKLAKKAHKLLGCRHYSLSDFIVSTRGVYLLGINILPELADESLLSKSLEAVGCPYHYFLDHLISLAYCAPREYNSKL